MYSVLICGHLESGEEVIDTLIAKDPAQFPRMTISAINGKATRSHYQVVDLFYQQREDGSSLRLFRVELIPGTDRTHQLRIHCQLLGHPILGCDP